MGARNHNTSKTAKNKKPNRGTTSAHTLTAPVKQNTQRERERGRPLNAMETKQKQLRCSAHAARQDGSGACRAKESTNGPAWVCMQYIQWAHYVCASWGEVRARVHARGHTQRGSEGRVCVRAVHGALSLTLTRPPPQLQPHTQQEEAKKGRWCGRLRCCCRCRQVSPYLLFELLLLLLGLHLVLNLPVVVSVLQLVFLPALPLLSLLLVLVVLAVVVEVLLVRCWR
ncbi:hypothetical protein ECC02_013667 [Trypanosoma cruzi]|uniref:Uncharacterized protein n=1 Tax=Trypanosoma cruzi TaxID=5693 RepID=A0A7J6XGS6_TRYCR|nr:hypothetical protein ECC02_013667 [Trypanosoma cruzi]